MLYLWFTLFNVPLFFRQHLVNCFHHYSGRIFLLYFIPHQMLLVFCFVRYLVQTCRLKLVLIFIHCHFRFQQVVIFLNYIFRRYYRRCRKLFFKQFLYLFIFYYFSVSLSSMPPAACVLFFSSVISGSTPYFTNGSEFEFLTVIFQNKYIKQTKNH